MKNQKTPKKNFTSFPINLDYKTCAILITLYIFDKTNASQLKSALINASFEGHLEMVKFLLDYGVDIYAKDKDGDTALLAAAISGQKELVNFL